MTIPASLVKELRDMTGAGMMDVKRALVEADGDVEEARKILRERGMAAASKREGRQTTEGLVLTRVEGARGSIVAVGCETEPVSKNEEFVAFAERLLDVVHAEGPDAAGDLEEDRVELVAKLGENIEIRGAARMEAGEDEVIADYVHPPARKIGVLVRATGTPDLAKMVAMHIAASPDTRYLSRDEVPEAAIQEEREIYAKLPDVQEKPEDIRPKIVEGMIAKRFYASSVVREQPWVHDPSLTVEKALAEHGAEIREFVRLSVAG
jgi:elongation factor Ts